MASHSHDQATRMQPKFAQQLALLDCALFAQAFRCRSRIIAGGILNIGQDFRSSVRISRLARFEACASRSPWHLPDIAC
jgi:hypothetical protein